MLPTSRPSPALGLLKFHVKAKTRWKHSTVKNLQCTIALASAQGPFTKCQRIQGRKKTHRQKQLLLAVDQPSFSLIQEWLDRKAVMSRVGVKSAQATLLSAVSLRTTAFGGVAAPKSPPPADWAQCLSQRNPYRHFTRVEQGDLSRPLRRVVFLAAGSQRI